MILRKLEKKFKKVLVIYDSNINYERFIDLLKVNLPQLKLKGKCKFISINKIFYDNVSFEFRHYKSNMRGYQMDTVIILNSNLMEDEFLHELNKNIHVIFGSKKFDLLQWSW